MNKLDIPFISSRGFECGQTCAAMTIKYFYPEFESNFDEFNKLIHHRIGNYTFPLQNAILIDHYGVETKCFSSENELTSGEDPMMFDRWFGDQLHDQMQYVDIESRDWMVTEGKKRGIFNMKITSFKDLLDYFRRGYIVTLAIDWNTLKQRNDNYRGHFVSISGIDGDDILIHDPDEGAYISYLIDILSKAYNHPAISNDCIIGFKKK